VTPAEAVAAEQVETNPLYARDITGDGIAEPWCNLFVENVCRRLGALLPAGLRANEQVEWMLSDAGKVAGWEEVDGHVARAMADAELLVVPGWVNPGALRADGSRPSGHVGVLLAGGKLAQAGARRFSSGTVAQGFGARVPTYLSNARIHSQTAKEHQP
jgi:hypothetical protein